MNIKDFRVLESATKGFVVQKLIDTYSAEPTWYNPFKEVKIQIWIGVDEKGNHIRITEKSYSSKSEAYEALTKICTPDVFHYPVYFKNEKIK